MNIYDISKKAGVSIATVSRVLNNNKNVSEKTRQKVMNVMSEENYQPNAFARGLTLNTMRTVGLLCADSSDPYMGSAIAYIEQKLRSHSYDSLLCCTGYEHSQKEKCMDMLLFRHVDALVLIGSNIYSALCDDAEATYNATIRLINSGCEKPLFLYREDSFSGLKKIEGFKKAPFCLQFIRI